MNNVSVTQLFIYPVKSLAGISLAHSEIDNMGLQYDRRWMIVTPEGDFMSQRKTPEMVLIKPAINNGQLTLNMEGKDSHIVPAISSESEKMDVVIWGDSVKATLIGDNTDAWLSDILGVPCRLVFMEDEVLRQCDLDFSKKGDQTGFADGFPILVISEESLDDLNSRLPEAVDMRRFRPNIVIKGVKAFAEDKLKEFTIGHLSMKGVKLCSRCPMPMVNPDLGKRTGQEPIATLSTYRKWEGKVYFGMNVIHQENGKISVGDALKQR